MSEVSIHDRRYREMRLRATAHVTPLRAGEDVMPIPFFNLHRPIGDLLRAGHDRARDRVWSLMVARLDGLADRRRSGDRTTIRTPAGVLTLTLLGNSDFSVRLTIAPGVWITSGELVARGQRLSATIAAAAVGRTVREMVGVPACHPFADVRITGVRDLGTSSRMRLDMEPDEIRLRDLGDDPDETLELTRREAFAIAS